MRNLTILVKLIILISMVIAGLTFLKEQASAQRAQQKPPRRFQRMATIDDLEPRRETTTVISRDRLRRPLPSPEELPPFVKPGDRIPSGMLRDLEPSKEKTLRRIDARKPIPAPAEPKP
jgi:hypothetical protein